MMNADQLVECNHCGGPLCYERHTNSVVSWDCITCGYTTNTLLMKNTEAVLSYESMLPLLYKDLKYIDKDGLVWYPTYIKVDGKGIIFADGDSAKSWRWSVALQHPVEEHEKEKYKIANEPGRYHQFKTDLKNRIQLDPDQFARALEILGLV